MRMWSQAAGEYAAAAGQTGGGATRIEGLDRILETASNGWSAAMAFAMEHPVWVVLGGVILLLVVERLLVRRSWRF